MSTRPMTPEEARLWNQKQHCKAILNAGYQSMILPGKTNSSNKVQALVNIKDIAHVQNNEETGREDTS